jgi:translation initiation factor 1
MKGNRKVELHGGDALGQNPFGALDGVGLPPAPRPEAAAPGPGTGSGSRPAGRSAEGTALPKQRGRIEIRREKSGRGGKIVTTASGFQGVCPAERDQWVSELRKSCGAGGAAKPGAIEIQGDRRDDLFRFFAAKGFRPVMAGG